VRWKIKPPSDTKFTH